MFCWDVCLRQVLFSPFVFCLFVCSLSSPTCPETQFVDQLALRVLGLKGVPSLTRSLNSHFSSGSWVECCNCGCVPPGVCHPVCSWDFSLKIGLSVYIFPELFLFFKSSDFWFPDSVLLHRRRMLAEMRVGEWASALSPNCMNVCCKHQGEKASWGEQPTRSRKPAPNIHDLLVFPKPTSYSWALDPDQNQQAVHWL